jgi:hypothetical protein
MRARWIAENFSRENLRLMQPETDFAMPMTSRSLIDHSNWEFSRKASSSTGVQNPLMSSRCLTASP